MTTSKHQQKLRALLGLVGILLVGTTPQVKAVVTFTNLHSFNIRTDGGAPEGLLAQGRDGYIYGTAPSNGAFGDGTVFKISPSGAFSVFRHFHNTVNMRDGSGPSGGLTLGWDGNFYGTTSGGGTNLQGTLYRLSPTGVVTILHNFGPTDAFVNPFTPPVQGRDGSLYGVVAGVSNVQAGAIYRYTLAGVFSLIHQFDPATGHTPQAPLIVGNDGNLYGTTLLGGSKRLGTVFRVSSTGAYKVLYNFGYIPSDLSTLVHGAYPFSPVMQAKDGNFYGTTSGGGASSSGGTIFSLTPAGVLTTLHIFDQVTAPNQGFGPVSGLTEARDGSFYGVTYDGGGNNCGVLYRLTKTGLYSVIHHFNLTDGCHPQSTQLLHTNGKIYGLTKTFGSVYSLDIGNPAIVAASPNAAKAGSVIGVFGDFTGVTGIKFNGISATLTGTSNTFRFATVPPGSATGLITLTKPSGTLSSIKTFNVLPTFSSFAPLSGRVGSTVVLNGISLSQALAVYFAGTSGLLKVTPVINNDQRVTIFVPVGAITGRVYVVTKGGVGVSPSNFTVLP